MGVTTTRTLRTLLQAGAGTVLLLLASTDFRNFVANQHPAFVVYIPLAVALFTALHNAIENRG